MSTEEPLVGTSLVGNKLGTSDPYMEEFSIEMHRSASLRAGRLPNFAQADFQGLRDQLNARNLIEQLRVSSVDACCRILKEKTY